MPDQTNTQRLTISVNRTNAEKALQINLSQTDADGNGMGYRIAGPKHYNLGTTELLAAELTERDAAEIRQMLDAVFPPTMCELRRGTTDEADTVTTYALASAARAHGEHAYRERFGHADDLRWRPETPADDSPLRLYATDMDGEETETDWHVVPVRIASAFTPEGGAR